MLGWVKLKWLRWVRLDNVEGVLETTFSTNTISEGCASLQARLCKDRM